MRYPFLDALRGFSICSMTLYHLLWDAVYLGGCSLPWYEGTAGYLWQQSICWVFIAVSGAALALEIKKKGRKRTAKSRLVLVGWGSAITFVTRQAMPHEPIYFGVLFFLGCSVPADALPLACHGEKAQRRSYFLRRPLFLFAQRATGELGL